MIGSKNQIAWLSEPRLAAHALSQQPVWLWSEDASRILWANPTAAAVFDAASPAAAADLTFDPGHPAVVQVARIAGTLPQGEAARLERLRGFGAAFGGTLVCLVSRLTFFDNSAGILIVSTERARTDLPLAERANRLLQDFERGAAALFTADGEWIAGGAAARTRLADQHDLVQLGAAELAREATLNGRAEGGIPAGQIVLLKLGTEARFFLLMIFPEVATAAPPAEQQAAQEPAPVIVPAFEPPQTPIEASTRAHRPPVRFVWEMDAAGRFTQGIDAFARLLGPQTVAPFDRPWGELGAALELDAAEPVAQALAGQDTWSGIVVHWPVDEGGERLAIELSGLPVFDRDRRFVGFRGFAICRDQDRLAALERRRTRPQPPPQPEEPAKVLPFRPPAAAIEPETLQAEQPPLEEPLPQVQDLAPALSPGEHFAFQELARELSERLKRNREAGATAAPGKAPSAPSIDPAPPQAPQPAAPPRAARKGDAARDAQEGRPILERLPVGILVYRLNHLLYANRAFLEWTGYPTLEALNEAGGLDSLFIESKDPATQEARNGGKSLTISTVNGDQKSVEGRLFSVAWHNENALVLMITTQEAPGEREARASDAALRQVKSENRELQAILDTATDGVLVLDRTGRVLSANRSAQALFGYEATQLSELWLGDLLAPESRRHVLEHFVRLAHEPRVLDPGREAIGRVRQGGLVPLHITIGQIEDGDKLCAVMRDITAWKRGEEELVNARREAEKASTAKSEFLAKVSHEVRTPLNSIIGFSEVMIQERFGPIANERYRQYLADIHSAGSHLVSLVNDLLDLSKIEGGKLDLSFVSVDLNELVQQCVAILQPEANRQRVIIRSSLPANLPPIVADARSVRQIALNLLSNSIKFTGAGGQVIVSTAHTDDREVAMRVRDTGTGMSEKELETALEPFRQIATASRWGASGTGLGLPITKALAEANHARFRITSRRDEGTLVEVAFPATRMLA